MATEPTGGLPPIASAGGRFLSLLLIRDLSGAVSSLVSPSMSLFPRHISVRELPMQTEKTFLVSKVKVLGAVQSEFYVLVSETSKTFLTALSKSSHESVKSNSHLAGKLGAFFRALFASSAEFVSSQISKELKYEAEDPVVRTISNIDFRERFAASVAIEILSSPALSQSIVGEMTIIVPASLVYKLAAAFAGETPGSPSKLTDFYEFLQNLRPKIFQARTQNVLSLRKVISSMSVPELQRFVVRLISEGLKVETLATAANSYDEETYKKILFALSPALRDDALKYIGDTKKTELISLAPDAKERTAETIVRCIEKGAIQVEDYQVLADFFAEERRMRRTMLLEGRPFAGWLASLDETWKKSLVATVCGLKTLGIALAGLDETIVLSFKKTMSERQKSDLDLEIGYATSKIGTDEQAQERFVVAERIMKFEADAREVIDPDEWNELLDRAGSGAVYEAISEYSNEEIAIAVAGTSEIAKTRFLGKLRDEKRDAIAQMIEKPPREYSESETGYYRNLISKVISGFDEGGVLREKYIAHHELACRGDFEGAIKALSEIAQTHAGFADVRRRLQALTDLQNFLSQLTRDRDDKLIENICGILSRGRYFRRIRDFLETREEKLTSEPAARNLGLSYLELGDTSSAHKWMRAVLAIEKDNIFALECITEVFAREGKYKDAYNIGKNALARGMKVGARIRAALVRACVCTDRFEEAEVFYGSLYAKTSVERYLKAACASLLGKVREAKDLLSRLSNTAPDLFERAKEDVDFADIDLETVQHHAVKKTRTILVKEGPVPIGGKEFVPLRPFRRY
ncbi:MAG: hypothetical protein NUW37_15680 [Planctomycetes bacterium]|nr:hypothetical protein [Planctomycetota bacterium]